MKFLLSINYIYWLIISAVFFAAGEFLSKKFALGPKLWLGALVIFIYALGSLVWLPAILQKKSLIIAGAMWSVLSLVATILIGAAVFGERLNWMGIIGIIAGFVSVILLSLG